MQNYKYTASEFHFYTSQLYYVGQVSVAPGGGIQGAISIHGLKINYYQMRWASTQKIRSCSLFLGDYVHAPSPLGLLPLNSNCYTVSTIHYPVTTPYGQWPVFLAEKENNSNFILPS